MQPDGVTEPSTSMSSTETILCDWRAPKMNNLPRTSLNFALALTLSFGSAAVLAMGSGTQSFQAGASMQYRCSTTAASLETSAKSPQQNRSYACAPFDATQAFVPTGSTTAKTPSRAGSGLITPEPVNDVLGGQDCTEKC